jgi:GINS complex subunit 4
MVDLMLGQLVHMEENLKALDKSDFRLITHKMELERIRYVLASYLRCRLQKIEEYTVCILNEEEERAADKKRLTPNELEFAKAYCESIENHFQQLIFRHMPDKLSMDEEQRVVRPNLYSYVFFKTRNLGELTKKK